MAKAKKAVQAKAPVASALPTVEEAMAAAPAFAMPPTICPSVFSATWTSNECMIVMARPNPLIQAQMPDGSAGTMAEPISILQLSPQSAKDLFLVIQDGVEKYEKEWGEIVTQYTRTKKS